MLFILIKNNFKLMLRSKWILVVMVIGPILVISVLSNVFEEMMKSYQAPESFSVGYSIDKTSSFSVYMELIEEAAAESDIYLVEYSNQDALDVVEKNDCAAFIEFGSMDYTIYRVEGYETEGRILEYFITSLTSSMMMQSADLQPVEIETVQLEAMPEVESSDYYGIVYTVYFIWCCFISIAMVISSERKHHIQLKYQITLLSDLKLYLARVVPCIIISTLGIGISTLISTAAFEIKWGCIPLTILLLFVNIVAGAAVGVFFSTVFNNLAISITISFVGVWIAGFIGGSFQSYLFTRTSEFIKSLSPLYHVNRALVEYSALGSSSYTDSSMIYLGGIIVIFTLLSVGCSKWKRGKAS